MTRGQYPPRTDRGSDGTALSSWGLALCLATIPALAFSQSLGDAAREERERRGDPNRTRTATRTVTADELASNEGQLANDPNVVPSGSVEEEPDATRPPRARIVRIRPASPTAGRGEEHWRFAISQAQLKVAFAKADYEDLLRQIRFGQPPQYVNGRRVIKSAQTMKAMADVAEEDLRRAEKELEDLLEEARRDGALPGWWRGTAEAAAEIVREHRR